VQGDLHIDKKTHNEEQRSATKIDGSSADRPENITENQQQILPTMSLKIMLQLII